MTELHLSSLSFFHGRRKRWKITAAGDDGCGEPGKLAVELRQLGVERLSLGSQIVFGQLKACNGLLEDEAIRADALAPQVIRHAAVDKDAAGAGASAPNVETSSTPAAFGKAGQEVLGVDPIDGPSPTPAVRAAQIGLVGGLKSRVGRVPELVRDDLECRCRVSNPLRLGARTWLLDAPEVALLRAIPDDDAPVEVAKEDFPN